MPEKYCLPIIKGTKQQVLEEIGLSPDYQLYEIWLDYIQDLDTTFVTILAQKYKKQILFVFRRRQLEPIKMNLKRRLEILSLLDNTDIFIDLDILTQQEEFRNIFTTKSTVNSIASYHNYQETPPSTNLMEIVSMMQQFNPTMYKIATFCNVQNDAIRLLCLQQELKQKKLKHIILGMGEYGTITRIYGSLWGNEFIFAPQSKSESSAAGQLTKKEMQAIISVIRNS